jgi:hypothetical protein
VASWPASWASDIRGAMRPQIAKLWLMVAVSAPLATLIAAGADARVEADSDYSKAQTYSAALRYLRVDKGFEVLEKDPEAAYLIFKYETPGAAKSSSNGTIEIVEAGERVKLLVQLQRMPEYHERVLKDGLLRKLREEYGSAIRRPVDKKNDKKAADAGSG